MKELETPNNLNIASYIIKHNKLDVILNYNNIRTFDDLKLFSHFQMKNISDTDIFDNFQCPTKIQFLSKREKEIAFESIKKGITNIGIDEVLYEFNELGYRGSNNIKNLKNSIGTFGCSYTFGEAMPEEKTFTYILQDKINQPIFNFGIPGGSIQKITKTFCSINNYYKLKKAIFVLPSLYRYEHIYNMNKKYIDSIDFLPSWPMEVNGSTDSYYSIYNSYDDFTFLNEFIKNINLIKQNAKINETDIILSTWDPTLYEYMKDLKIGNPDNLIKIQFLENERKGHGENVTNYARDGVHPGLESHTHSAELIYNFIKNNKIILDKKLI
jgi:hypothetical protein